MPTRIHNAGCSGHASFRIPFGDHPLKLERSREDSRGPCARTQHKSRNVSNCDGPRKVLTQWDSCPVQCMSFWWASKGVETMGFLPNALHVKWMKFKHWVIMTPLPWPILCLRPFQGIPILLNCFLFKGFLSFVFKAFLRGSYPFQWFICLRDSYPDRCFFHHLWGCGVFRFQVRHVFLLLLILLLVCLQDTCRIPSK